jgi:hypothetical protein
MSSAAGRPPAAIPPPRRPNNAVWWILGIVAGGILVMIFFGLSLAGLFIHNLHVHDEGKQVEIQTPVGGLKVNGDAPHASGLPVYPDTKSSSDNGNANVEFSAGDVGVGIAVEKYTSRDSLDKVTAWYAQRLGPSFRREKPGDRTVVHGVDATNDADVAFVDDHGDGVRVVALTRKDDEIEIVLVHAGKKEAQ